jgi:hypothetical protein
MRSARILAFAAALSATASVFAQDQFPDVPANHWAYEALARMKRDGLLVGYPDGLFRGGRPASRYELAVAMHAVYTNLKNVTDGLDAQVRALSDQMRGAPTAADLQALKDAIAALQSDLAAMRGYGDDIAALKRAAETFDRELKSLGVDVEAMKKDLGDLAGRVSALENKRPSIEVSGDVNFLVLAGNSNGGNVGLSQDGRFVGVGRNGTTAGLTDDLNVLHEAAFTVATTKTDGVKFKATGVIGNMLSSTGDVGATSLGSQSTLPFGRYSDSVSSDVYLQNAEASFDARALGIGFGIRIGRVEKSVSPYLFQRIDNTSYFSNERWDNGNYSLDGANVDFKKFGLKFSAFGGRTSERYSVNGVDVNQVVLGNNRVAGNPTGLLATSDETTNVPGAATSAFGADRTLGLQISSPLTKVGNLNLAYLWLDNDTTAGALFGIGGANRVEVYGGDVDFTFGRIKLSGGYSESIINDESNSLNAYNDENGALRVKVGFQGNRFNLFGEFRQVEANYVAPGDWGRLGILRNPGNIRGFTFGGSLNLSNRLVLSGHGSSESGLSTTDATPFAAQPFDNDTEISSWAARLDFKVNPNMSIYGAYEDTRFSDLTTQAATAKYRFATVGVAYGLSSNAKLNLGYQYSDVRNEAFLAGPFGDRYKGGLLSTQLTVKF